MLTGRVRVGSPTPVAGFPVWLTPEIVRGGFATGTAVAAGPLTPDEVTLAERAGVRPDRAAIFAWFRTDAGLRQLRTWLSTGRYRLDLPEHGALLAVAWLLDHGRADDADELLGVLATWSGQVRFWPYPSAEPELPGVYRTTLPVVADRLRRKRRQPRVEVQRDVLAVWAPFADSVLAHWWATRTSDGRVGARIPPGWAARATELLDEYARLAGLHALPRRYRDPKENLPILLAGMRAQLAGRVDPRLWGRVRGAVRDMVAKRGRPGSEELSALRRTQASAAAQPSYALLAHAAAFVLDATGQTKAVRDPVALLDGAPAAGLPWVRRAVRQATRAPVSDLLDLGVVRSAETLAELAPQLTAQTVAGRYADASAGRLAAGIYTAFTNRRSVLLLHHRTQVTVDVIPWFQLLERAAAERRAPLALQHAVDLGTLALQHFGGTVLPNALLRELARLFVLAGARVPLTYELAADIFMGSFSPVFLEAARTAAPMVGGTLYARYFGIDYDAILTMAPDRTPSWPRRGHRTVSAFDAMVHARAGLRPTGRWSSDVVANGRLIEQSQILTTQNLAALVRTGVDLDWAAQARAAWRTTKVQLSGTTGRKSLHHRKNAAYAWRQCIFYLSLAAPDDLATFLAVEATTTGLWPDLADRANDLLLGLSQVGDRGSPAEPFLGWTSAKVDR